MIDSDLKLNDSTILSVFVRTKVGLYLIHLGSMKHGDCHAILRDHLERDIPPALSTQLVVILLREESMKNRQGACTVQDDRPQDEVGLDNREGRIAPPRAMSGLLALHASPPKWSVLPNRWHAIAITISCTLTTTLTHCRATSWSLAPGPAATAPCAYVDDPSKVHCRMNGVCINSSRYEHLPCDDEQQLPVMTLHQASTESFNTIQSFSSQV